MSAPWLDELNPAQREAATYGDGPLLIVAGAGTGKTKTLVSRVAYLVDQGVDPGRILLLTFTRRASMEMLRRAGHLVGGETVRKVWGGTFHAVANRLLRIYARSIDLAPSFTIMDQSDAADLMHLIRTELGVAKGNRRFPSKGTLVRIYSLTVNAQTNLTDVLTRHFPWCANDREAIASIFQQYTQRKREHQVLDYDDLLLYWMTLCAAPGAGASVSDRFDHVLVDEYQDTNAIQARTLLDLRRTCRNLTVVGDDAQSIYSFRAATVRNILDFPDQFPGAHVVTLEQNYRSTRPILAVSNAVMEQASERFTKSLRSDRRSTHKPQLITCLDEAEQTTSVADQIIAHLEEGIPLQHQAVLFRTGHHSGQLEVELGRRNIPFHKFGGLKFIEAGHIKDMLAFLRILENPYDAISWYRVLQLLDGVGPRIAARIVDALGVRTRTDQSRAKDDGDEAATDGLSPMARLLRSPPRVSPAVRKGFDELRGAMADCLGATMADEKEAAATPLATDDDRPLPEQLERIRVFCEPLFENRYDNVAVRLRDIEQLEQIASGYESRGRFITDLTLDPPAATADLAQPPFLEEDFLILSTIHSAKGCEWTIVYVLHAADGMIPSDMATTDEAGVDEERRLFYVALTRAKDHLHVYFPLRYYHRRHVMGDAHGYAQLTRFISDAVRPGFEEKTAGVDPQFDKNADPASPTSAGELNRWLDGLWDA